MTSANTAAGTPPAASPAPTQAPAASASTAAVPTGSAPPSTAPARGAAPSAARAMSTATWWLILSAVLIADILDMIDSTLTNIAAPTIAADLGGGALFLKWLGCAYALSLGVLLVVGGRLGDKYGHRRTFLIGIAGFTLASLLCGLAPLPGVLIAGRLAQGAFGALLIPQGMAIMASSFPKETMGRAFSAFGPIMGVASVGGPILGAFIIHANLAGLGWRPMFLINIVLGACGLVLAARVLPRDTPDRSVVLDVLGSALLAVAMCALIYGLLVGSSDDWPASSLAIVAVGALAMVAFVLRQMRAANPLIKTSLFRHRGFSAGLVMGLAFFSVVAGLAYVVSLYMQQALHRSPVATAIQGVTPMAFGIIVASIVSAPLIARLGRNLILGGLIVTVAGTGLLWAVVHGSGLTTGAWGFVVPMAVIGFGMGSCFGTLYSFALGDIDESEAGSASGSLSAVQQLAASIGSAAITSVWFHRLADGGVPAMQACLVVVGVVTAACCAVVFLLPRTPAAEGGH